VSEKLNIDLRKLFVKNDGVGLERVSMLLGDSITKIETSLVKIFEGKPLPPGKKHRNALDRGIIPIVKEISEIDLCNVLTYVVNKTPQIVKNIPFSADKKDGSSQLADSTKKESRQKSQFERKVQDLQDKAYEAQKLIDKYYTNFSDSNNVESRIGLQNLSRNLQLVFTTTEEAQSLLTQSNRELSIAFPQLLAYNAFLENVFGFFNKFSDFSSLSSKEIDKIKSYVDKTRGVLVAIQAFDSKNPASLIGLGISALSPKIQEDLDKINKIVNPDKLLPFVKNIQSVCINIQNSVIYVLSIVSMGQRIINTAVRIVRVLQIVKRFIYVLLVALPNMFLTVGVNQAFSDGLKKIQDLLDKILKTLNQLNGILLRIIVVIEYIIAQIEEILRYVKIMILNLESCSNSDPEIVKQLKEVVTSLENSVKSLNDFKNNYKTKSSSKDNTFGDKTNKYSIRIVTEQLADEGITLKRRFGIAVDKNGVLVASSTPTFASEDSIIISEVKLILVSKKLVNPEMSELSGEGIRIINESLNFVQDDEVSINESLLDVDFSFDVNQEESLDDPNNENEDRGIGLNAFANKLPGGKKLRDRVRKRISAIIGNFSSQNPGVSVPISQNVTQGSTADTQYNKEQRIKQLQEKREELSKQRRRALLAGPAGVAIVAAKTKEIRDIDKQIEDLRK
jgi:hypothetical protein